MLILQRHPGQSFWVGNEIQIILLGHFNGVTHIGIEAPKDTKIVRDELRERELSDQND